MYPASCFTGAIWCITSLYYTSATFGVFGVFAGGVNSKATFIVEIMRPLMNGKVGYGYKSKSNYGG